MDRSFWAGNLVAVCALVVCGGAARADGADQAAPRRLLVDSIPRQLTGCGSQNSTARHVANFPLPRAVEPAPGERRERGPAPSVIRLPNPSGETSPPVGLPRASAVETRSPAFQAGQLQAARAIDKGFTLAGRGVLYTARRQFVQGLRLLAATADEAEGTTRHAAALAAGLQALHEAGDFDPSGAQTQVDRILLTHQTPLFKGPIANSITPRVARDRYLEFAQHQLADAIGSGRIGSMGLYGLARVHSTLADQFDQRRSRDYPRAMALHRASLTVEAGNFMAANELAVLLARDARFVEARDLLDQSLQASPQVTTWNNLAIVYERLGQPHLAHQARERAVVLVHQQSPGDSSGGQDVVWTPPQQFAGHRTSARR